jgi:TolB-like protein
MAVGILIVWTAVAATATSSTSTSASTSISSRRIAVFQLRSSDEHKVVAMRLLEAMLLELSHKPGVVAIGEPEMRVLAAHEKDLDDLEACTQRDECLARLRRIVEADEIVTGHIGRWGQGYLVTLSLSDAKRSIVERGESATADNPAELEGEVKKALGRLIRIEGAREGTFVLAPRAQATKIAVLNLAAYDVSPELADNLTQLLALELKKLEGINVISKDEIRAMLQYEADKHVLECKNDVACLAEIGGALGVQYLVTGGIGRLETTWVIHLKLMDIVKAEVVHRVSESFRGPERQLAQGVRFACWSLLGRRSEGSGRANLETEAQGGEISVDGGAPRPLSRGTLLGDLVIGKHALWIRADGYYGLQQDFYVEGGQTVTVRPDLVELPTPWYETWWVWTIIGGVVAAGGATTAVLLSHSASDGTIHVMIK